MPSYHKRSLFPLAVIALSLVLAGFMYWTFQDRSAPSTIAEEVVDPVDAEAYKDDLAQVVETFQARFAEAGDDLDKLLATETALAGLLQLRVPVEFKDLHLGLAVALHQIQGALKSGQRDVQEYLDTIATLQGQYDWLN